MASIQLSHEQSLSIDMVDNLDDTFESHGSEAVVEILTIVMCHAARNFQKGADQERFLVQMIRVIVDAGDIPTVNTDLMTDALASIAAEPDGDFRNLDILYHVRALVDKI